ncbi:PREDICTED: pentatricopeptide repeat-containing protein At4g20770 [Tarenaya hassleriana]|uniref:pentatricopeptide repeat-containing protein At4g20770 n=1 Tax=Tarenaya hassleriana TaxID=28532 RepID=UPI00053C48C1|nr:PREDICTED: pentatricopeptide repeat-containing protein At4g20770 [Tarenaya hassleriana]XP_010537438.1 PREDICTED: pentatricopeptide repeat-containing protein At4g20770 [Tarenaya hassleriana]XP_010537449.1 PREDICTED: pentatricopeptide repeat-containing protein At4g20770 [Tarenaya hassleriana]
MRSGKFQCIANLLRSCRDKRSHLSGKILHGFIVRTGVSSDTYLCNRLVDLYVECGDGDYARKVFRQMPVKDIYSWNTWLAYICRNGDLQEACQLFDEMPQRDVVSWNNLISALVRNGCEERALIVYERLVSEGFLPTRFTLASVLSACGKLLDDVSGKICHGTAVKIGLCKNIFVGNSLLSMYAKCGLMLDYGVCVFEDLSEPNEVSFTAVVAGLARENRVLEAVKMFRLMYEKGVRTDSVCLSNVLNVCAHGECDDWRDETCHNLLGKQIHCLVLKHGFLRDLYLNNSLLEIYAKDKSMDYAEQIFSEMSELNVVSWNIMIAGFGQEFRSDKSVEYLERMRDSGFEPNEVTYINALGACFRSENIETGRRIFDSMQNPSVGAWNAMLSGYSKYEYYEEAINFFRQMQFWNLKPDRITLSVILSSCARTRFLEGGKQVQAVSLKIELSTNCHIVSGLIAVYAECGKIEVSERIFDHIIEMDVTCWNSMIAGLARNARDMKALMLFKKMFQIRVYPNETSYSTVLGSCSRLSSLLHGRLCHGQIVKNGYLTDPFVGTALTNMYCKCGEVDSAREIFDTVSRKHMIIWNEMIHGYAQNGRGHEAVHLYTEMIASGEKPDMVTFVSVLTACSHSGLVEMGLEIFNSMGGDHGMEPELDHYICIIDCLGRAGRLKEAEILAENAPYRNSHVMWELLLSSCRIHGNVSLAKRVADKLMRLDPQNSAPYVLLGNTYSSLRQWDEAAALQGLMNKNRVLKNPGISRITNIGDRI